MAGTVFLACLFDTYTQLYVTEGVEHFCNISFQEKNGFFMANELDNTDVI